jgi:hypothetical protein
MIENFKERKTTGQPDVVSQQSAERLLMISAKIRAALLICC